jgi:hypothetical protein
MRDFKQDLQDQLAFIEASAHSAAAGHFREGVRIATAVRVIAHQTRNSTSLLTYLNSPNPTMFSSATPLPDQVVFGESGMTRFKMTNVGMFLEPALDQGVKRLVPLDEWWSERVFVLNSQKLTRSQLVLTAANKDGGAHVDPGLSSAYELLANGLWTASQDGSSSELAPQAMMTLIQIGYEVNHSPGILKLLDRESPAFLRNIDAN